MGNGSGAYINAYITPGTGTTKDWRAVSRPASDIQDILAAHVPPCKLVSLKVSKRHRPGLTRFARNDPLQKPGSTLLHSIIVKHSSRSYETAWFPILECRGRSSHADRGP